MHIYYFHVRVMINRHESRSENNLIISNNCNNVELCVLKSSPLFIFNVLRSSSMIKNKFYVKDWFQDPCWLDLKSLFFLSSCINYRRAHRRSYTFSGITDNHAITRPWDAHVEKCSWQMFMTGDIWSGERFIELNQPSLREQFQERIEPVGRGPRVYITWRV